MICYLTKWYISREQDTGRNIPGMVRRHIDRCDSCQEYARFTQGLSERAKSDASSLIAETPEEVMERIKIKAAEGVVPTRKHYSRRWLVPATSGAIAVILIAVILIFQPFQPSSQDLTGERSQILRALTLSEIDLRAYTGYIDSPFEKEWEGLKKAVLTSKDKLISHLSLRIARAE